MGAILGAFIGAPMANYGRRKVCIILDFIGLLGTLLQVSSLFLNNWLIMLIGRFIVGLVSGAN